MIASFLIVFVLFFVHEVLSNCCRRGIHHCSWLAFIKAFKLILRYAPLVRHTPGWRYHPEVSTGLGLALFMVKIAQASFIKECIGARGASDIMVPGERGKIFKKFEISGQKNCGQLKSPNHDFFSSNLNWPWSITYDEMQKSGFLRYFFRPFLSSTIAKLVVK